MKYHHLSSSKKRLFALRNELYQIEIPPYPNKLLPLLINWITKATPVIKQGWPHYIADFTKCATLPSGESLLDIYKYGNLSDQQLRDAWVKDNQEAQIVRQKILSFLEGLLSLRDTLSWLFYLIALLCLVAIPVIMFFMTHNQAITISSMPVTLLALTLIGAFYLRQSGSLSQKNFIQLIGMVFKQIPFLYKK
ncbi:MAG TPA: hypothetical protein VMT91_10495 [Anaerolineales bacterium]|nr:hypothetical protein [Anaerolineales bacterium]